MDNGTMVNSPNQNIKINQETTLNQEFSESDFFYSRLFADRSEDIGNIIITDSSDNNIIVGRTGSFDFPIVKGFNNTYGGNVDAAVIKLNSDGEILWSTYLGGTEFEEASGVAVDNNDNVIVTGYTESDNFPTFGNIFSDTLSGERDIFLSKFSSNGELKWSTYIGGTGRDGDASTLSGGNSRVVTDSDGNIFIGGPTTSTDFPIINGNQTIYGGGLTDSYLTKFNPNGSIEWSSYLGGSLGDRIADIALDSEDNIIVGGITESNDFPLSNGPQDSTPSDVGVDSFITKFTNQGSLIWSTYQGGDICKTLGCIGSLPINNLNSLVVDSQDNIVVASTVQTIDKLLATTSGFKGTGTEIYISKYHSNGEIFHGNYIGGTKQDLLRDMAIDQDDNIYLTASVDKSGSFVEVNPYFSSIGDFSLEKIIKVSPFNAIIWTTDYLGIGSRIQDLTIAEDGMLIVTGKVNDPSLPGLDTSGIDVSDSHQGMFLSKFLLDPSQDTDLDGLLNYEEFTNKLIPTNRDTDDDSVSDGDEVHTFLTDPNSPDSDNDGLNDGYEIDRQYDPNSNDTDGDGMPDKWEDDYRLDPTDPLDARLDSDFDGLSNGDEYKRGTLPKTPDTDNDGMKDGYEVDNGLDPLTDDSSKDKDNDYLNNKFEHDLGLNPNSPIELIVGLLIVISSVSGVAYFVFHRKKLNHLAKAVGFDNYHQQKAVEAKGFESNETMEEALAHGFLTQLARSIVNASGYQSVDDMISGWNSQISKIDVLLENLNLTELEQKVNSSTSPIRLHQIKNEYAPLSEKITILSKSIKNSIFLQEGIMNLPQFENELPTQNLDQHKLDILTMFTKQTKQKLDNNFSQFNQLFDDRMAWFIPWQPLLTLIQMTPDGIPIDLSKITEVIQCSEDQAESLLQLLLDDNPLVGSYDISKHVYTKGTDISNYLESMLTKMATFGNS